MAEAEREEIKDETHALEDDEQDEEHSDDEEESSDADTDQLAGRFQNYSTITCTVNQDLFLYVAYSSSSLCLGAIEFPCDELNIMTRGLRFDVIL